MPTQVRSVLFVTTSFPRFDRDAAGSFVFRLAKYLVQDGIKVTVLAPGAWRYPSTETIAGVQIHRFPYCYPPCLQRLAYEGGGMVVNLRRHWWARLQVPLLFGAMIWAVLRHQERYDLIHCHWLPTAVAALIARMGSRTKPVIVFTNWGSDTRFLPQWLTRWTVTRVEGCVSTAIETDEHLLAAGRTEFRRIMAPVDEERFSPTTVAPDMRAELQINAHLPVLAFVGRLYEDKAPLTFIQACALLQQEGVEFIAPIAGDGPLMAACQAEVQRQGLQTCVRFLGMRPDTERLLRIATATVNIDRLENTWANTIAEAMFMQVPVVLSNAGYTERLFTHATDCLIVPICDPRALADALKRLIDDAALRQALVQGALHLLRRYKKDQVNIIRDLRAYYDELSCGNSTTPHAI